MEQYIEVHRCTETRAQFAAQCRRAIRPHETLRGWVEYIDGAIEEMDEIARGERESYRHVRKADEERRFDETCAASADAWQIYYKSCEPGVTAQYNMIFEWSDGFGYMYLTQTQIVN